jgi:hypothetical protein
MAANRTPILVRKSVLGACTVSVANTNRDGTGNLKELLNAAAYPNGIHILYCKYVAAGTVTAGVLRFFDFDGTTKRLIHELLITATTPSTTVAVAMDRWEELYPIDLPAGHSLLVGTHNAETFNVFAFAYASEDEV